MFFKSLIEHTKLLPTVIISNNDTLGNANPNYSKIFSEMNMASNWKDRSRTSFIQKKR